MKRAAKVAEALIQADVDTRTGDDLIREQMSPPGTLGLPPLLEKRRWEELIPDGAFKTQALFDRILVMQVAPEKGQTTFAGTNIIMTDSRIDRIEDEACRGIIVSAGLLALTELRTNGCDLGHYVRFIKNAPWRMKIDTVKSKDIHELVMRSGDLVSSEDLSTALREGRVKVAYNAETKVYAYVTEDGMQWDPQMPWMPDDT